MFTKSTKHEFHETCHSVTFIVLVNSHQRWKQTRNRICLHLWCELTLMLWCHSIVCSLFHCCSSRSVQYATGTTHCFLTPDKCNDEWVQCLKQDGPQLCTKCQDGNCREVSFTIGSAFMAVRHTHIIMIFVAVTVMMLLLFLARRDDIFAWIPWNSSFRYILFHEKRLQTMLWHHNARVNSHQRWKQTRFRVCFHLWCELTNTMRCNGMTNIMEFICCAKWWRCLSAVRNTIYLK